MSLWRTSTKVRLKSDDGLHYDVALVDEGGGVIVPDADEDTGAVSTYDAYVALVGSDGLIYRWSLETIGPQNVQHLIDLSTNQSEPALVGLDLLLGSQWFRVKVELQATTGSPIPNLIVVDGSAWNPKVRRGGLSTFTKPIRTFARY